MDTIKKIIKVLSIITVIAGICYGAYVLVKKLCEKKNAIADKEENYVSCSCLDADFCAEKTK